MTEELKERFRKGGKCSQRDFELLMQELPYEVDVDLDSDDRAKYIAYRTGFWFYIHEVRGYCAIHLPYVLYEPEFTSPDLDEKLQYLERKDEQEAFVFIFYDRSRQKAFSSYEKLEDHFIALGGHQGADLKKDPEFLRLYNKESFDRKDLRKLFAYRNYVVSCPKSHGEDLKIDPELLKLFDKKTADGADHWNLFEYRSSDYIGLCLPNKENTAVIWINEHEHCTMGAWYYLDEIKRVKLDCIDADITFYRHGVPVRCIPFSSDTDKT